MYCNKEYLRSAGSVFFIVGLSTVGVAGILVHGKIASIGNEEPVFPFKIYLL
jgi:hypothetical protein